MSNDNKHKKMIQKFKRHGQFLDELKTFSYLKRHLGGKSEPKKTQTEFVKRMNELKARIKNELIWDSLTHATYCRKLHGEIGKKDWIK